MGTFRGRRKYSFKDFVQRHSTRRVGSHRVEKPRVESEARANLLPKKNSALPKTPHGRNDSLPPTVFLCSVGNTYTLPVFFTCQPELEGKIAGRMTYSIQLHRYIRSDSCIWMQKCTVPLPWTSCFVQTKAAGNCFGLQGYLA